MVKATSESNPSGAGQRYSRQRDALWSVVCDAARPLSPQEMLEAARAFIPTMGQATVYRNIKLLVDEGKLVPVEVPGQAPSYEQAGLAHHHHFFCNDCRRTFEMQGCPSGLEKMAPRGFEVERHEVTLIGKCTDCRK